MQAACDRRSNAARRTGPLQTGLRPETPATALRGPREPHSAAARRACARLGDIQGGFLASRSSGQARGGSMQAACDRRSNAARRTDRQET